jgi:cell fate regulator YaaT (PSP1 superfamily)
MIVAFYVFKWKSLKNLEISEEVKVGEKYILQNNFGQFIGSVYKVYQEEKKDKSSLAISKEEDRKLKNNTDRDFKLVRKFNKNDLEKVKELDELSGEILKSSREKIKKYDLPMKLVGVNHSLDGGSMIIAFTAESRIDFRELVRELSYQFQKAVRLEQIGSRDEAKIVGGHGPCGQKLCCTRFNCLTKSINTDMARLQQITHRGNERISGCCGRLMCCLSYEIDNYEEYMKNLPSNRDQVKVKGRIGEVKNIKVLQNKILVAFPDKNKQEVEKHWFDVSEIEIIKKKKK